MGIYTTKPIKEASKEGFKGLIKNKEIKIHPHALFHLSNRQRKVFNEGELTFMLRKETPRKVYLQENGRYAAYYRKKDGYRKIIVEIRDEKNIIITFIDVLELPKIRIENDKE